MLRPLSYIWPLPCTLVGLAIGLLPWSGKRSIVFRKGTIGIYGPALARILSRIPINGGAAAITLGNTILARDSECFDSSFEHEYIHVQQYIWWGPIFPLAYLFNSAWHWVRGRDPYLDNDFEKQARRFSGSE